MTERGDFKAALSSCREAERTHTNQTPPHALCPSLSASHSKTSFIQIVRLGPVRQPEHHVHSNGLSVQSIGQFQKYCELSLWGLGGGAYHHNLAVQTLPPALSTGAPRGKKKQQNEATLEGMD